MIVPTPLPVRVGAIVIERLGFPGAGEAGRAVGIGAIVIVEAAEQGQNEHPGHDQDYGTANSDKTELGDHAVLIQLEKLDRQQQQDEQPEEQRQREQPHTDDVAREPEGGEQDAEQRPHRIGAGGAGKITGGAREAHAISPAGA